MPTFDFNHQVDQDVNTSSAPTAIHVAIVPEAENWMRPFNGLTWNLQYGWIGMNQ
jgi:hypothetical protein